MIALFKNSRGYNDIDSAQVGYDIFDSTWYPWLLVHGFGFKLNHLNSIDERFFVMDARLMVKTFESALITTIPKRCGLRLRR